MLSVVCDFAVGSYVLCFLMFVWVCSLYRSFFSFCVFFFFSSRRRHTRFDCDWSSDVCSSDLLRERVQREMRKADLDRRLDDFAHRLHALGVSAKTRQPARPGPTPVAVHDDGDVSGQISHYTSITSCSLAFTS